MVSIIPCRLAAFTIGLLWLAGFAFPQDAAAPPEPLHRRIDALSQPEFPWLIGAKLDDTQSLRRLSLDLRNTVPSLDELDAFLAEPPDGRWERWVNRFLADPLHRERVVD